MADRSLDSATLDAIGVLARAVEQEREPGKIDFLLLNDALRRAGDSGNHADLAEAARVFHRLDGATRARIVARATAEAHALAGRGEAAREAVTVEAPGALSPAPGLSASRPDGAAPRPAKRSVGSSFLAALNGFRPGRAKADSRDAAKGRLMAAVETQRALPVMGLDEVIEGGGLRPGQPLPRSA
ncbi:hypothetical protein [Azospirillum griseum]|uniref:hypothetical protein n=1 Tax=Azospirillum griseum TaxID=2496639 RepID=UPI001AED03C3|nr:hypothetical protein [Azospirillum griseum]